MRVNQSFPITKPRVCFLIYIYIYIYISLVIITYQVRCSSLIFMQFALNTFGYVWKLIPSFYSKPYLMNMKYYYYFLFLSFNCMISSIYHFEKLTYIVVVVNYSLCFFLIVVLEKKNLFQIIYRFTILMTH